MELTIRLGTIVVMIAQGEIGFQDGQNDVALSPTVADVVPDRLDPRGVDSKRR